MGLIKYKFKKLLLILSLINSILYQFDLEFIKYLKKFSYFSYLKELDDKN